MAMAWVAQKVMGHTPWLVLQVCPPPPLPPLLLLPKPPLPLPEPEPLPPPEPEPPPLPFPDDVITAGVNPAIFQLVSPTAEGVSA